MTSLKCILFTLAFAIAIALRTDEDLALVSISNYNIALERNSIWIEKLKAKDKSLMSFVEAITLKYEIHDIIKFLKKNCDKIRQYDYKNFQNETLKRYFKIVLEDAYNILPLNETIAVAEGIATWNYDFVDEEQEEKIVYCKYEQLTECFYDRNDLIRDISYSNNGQELEEWLQRQMLDVGAERRNIKYENFLKLFNKAAKLNGFNNAYEMIIHPYEDDEIDEKVNNMMSNIFPFYQQMHARIRNLIQKHNSSNLLQNETRLMPDYIMKKIIIESLISSSSPRIDYPIEKEMDNSKNMSEIITAESMVLMAEEFYTSIGLNLNKMKYKVIVSEHQISPEFDDKFGRRELTIFLSPYISEANLSELFAEMLDLLKFQTSYYKQPVAFRKITPPGFSSALSHAMSLSALSPTYLHKMKLLDEITEEYLLNKLYKMAYQILLPLQRAFVVKETMKCLQTRALNQSNCKHWDNKKNLQGVVFKGRISEYDVFDDKDNSINMDDLQPIFTTLVSFQIYEGLCKKVGQYIDDGKHYLANCDLSGHKDIGKIIDEILSDGAFKPWQEHLRKLSDDKDISSSSFLKYFLPLRTFLVKDNILNKVVVGW